MVGGVRHLSRRSARAWSEIFPRRAAAQCYRIPAHRPHAGPHRDRHRHALASHARRQHVVPSGHRSRRNRHANAGGTQPGRRRHHAPAARPRGIRPPRLGVEGEIRQPHHLADEAHRRQLRLEPRAIHAESRPFARRAGSLRAPLRTRPNLSRHVHGQLVPALRHRAFRSGSEARGHARQPVAHPLSGEWTARAI